MQSFSLAMVVYKTHHAAVNSVNCSHEWATFAMLITITWQITTFTPEKSIQLKSNI